MKKYLFTWDMCALAFSDTNFSSFHLKLKLKFQCASTILDLKITDWNLISEDVVYVAQIYDGTSAVSGVLNGSQELFRQPHPYAIMHVFTATHIFLNLVLVGTCSTLFSFM